IKVADKQAVVEKLQLEAMTSNQQVKKLQQDLIAIQKEMSSYALLFKGLSIDNSTLSDQEHDDDMDELDNNVWKGLKNAKKALNLRQQKDCVMDVPLLLDHEFDFFAAKPVPGLSEAPDNQNGWIEWDVPLGGEMDEPMERPMETPGFDDMGVKTIRGVKARRASEEMVISEDAEVQPADLIAMESEEFIEILDLLDFIGLQDRKPPHHDVNAAPVLALQDGPRRTTLWSIVMHSKQVYFGQNIPEWKWEKNNNGLSHKLPRSNHGYECELLVIEDRLTQVDSMFFQPIVKIKNGESWQDLNQNEILCKTMIAYRLKLPQELSCVHNTFHVSNLKKCLAEPDVQVPLEEIEVDENLRFVEEPIEIVERDVKNLKRRRIPLVKVRWNSRKGAEYTWEREDQFRKKYPHLFTEPVPSSSVVT
ncbi:hypothetical protein Tco_0593969, partial [Tanacetum coccineum]